MSKGKSFMLELTKRAVLMAEGVGRSGVVVVVVVMVDGGSEERGEGDAMDGERGGDVGVVVMEGGSSVVDGEEAGAEEATESRTIHLAANQRTVRCWAPLLRMERSR